MKISARILLAAILFFVAIGTLSAQSWTKVGGTAPFVHKIYFPPANPAFVIVAADSFPVVNELSTNQQSFFWGKGPNDTYIANGFRISQDSGKTFGAPKLEGNSVRDIIQLPGTNNIWLAAIAQNTGAGTIVISTDNGATWPEFDPVQLPMRCANRPFTNLAAHNSGNTIYSAHANDANGFRTTQDTFNLCTGENITAQPRDISASPIAPGLVFIADQAEGIKRSTDFGKTWETFNAGLENLRVLSVMSSRTNSGLVFAGADSLLSTQTQEYTGAGIYRSIDSGRTWQLVGAKDTRIWEIREHPLDPRYVIAAGDSSGIWVSGDNGRTWQQMSAGIPQGQSVRTVGFPAWSTQGGAIAFAGVSDAQGGLYRSDRIFIEPSSIENSVENISFSIENIIPQPAQDEVTISWKNSSEQKIKISLSDIYGKEIFLVSDGIAPVGESNTTLDLRGLAQGTYFLTVQSGKNSIARKILVVKE